MKINSKARCSLDRHADINDQMPSRMSLDRLNNRIERDDEGTDPIGERRGIYLYTLTGIGITLTVQRLMQRNFETSTIASRLGPAKPRGIGCEGAGALVMLSQSRHENFSRSYSTIFQRRLACERLRDDFAGTIRRICHKRKGWLNDPFDRQIVGQLARPAWATGEFFLGGFRGRNLSLRCFGCLRLLKLFDRKLDLLDQKLATFQGLAELRPTGLRQHPASGARSPMRRHLQRSRRPPSAPTHWPEARRLPSPNQNQQRRKPATARRFQNPTR